TPAHLLTLLPGAIPPESTTYFYGKITREQAEELLFTHGASEGLFLLRESVNRNYAVSICHLGRVHHYNVERQTDCSYRIQTGHKFIGPVELVQHHSTQLDGFLTLAQLPLNRPAGISPIVLQGLNADDLDKNLRLKAIEMGLKGQSVEEALNGPMRNHLRFLVIKDLHLLQPWYHHTIRRYEAELRLANEGNKEGAFLVRYRKDDRTYVLSLSCQNEPKHYRIEEYLSRWSIEGGQYFETIMELIDHYHFRQDGLLCKLQKPIPVSNFTRALTGSFGVSKIATDDFKVLINPDKNQQFKSPTMTSNVWNSSHSLPSLNSIPVTGINSFNNTNISNQSIINKGVNSTVMSTTITPTTTTVTTTTIIPTTITTTTITTTIATIITPTTHTTNTVRQDLISFNDWPNVTKLLSNQNSPNEIASTSVVTGTTTTTTISEQACNVLNRYPIQHTPFTPPITNTLSMQTPLKSISRHSSSNQQQSLILRPITSNPSNFPNAMLIGSTLIPQMALLDREINDVTKLMNGLLTIKNSSNFYILLIYIISFNHAQSTSSSGGSFGGCGGSSGGSCEGGGGGGSSGLTPTNTNLSTFIGNNPFLPLISPTLTRRTSSLGNSSQLNKANCTDNNEILCSATSCHHHSTTNNSTTTITNGPMETQSNRSAWANAISPENAQLIYDELPPSNFLLNSQTVTLKERLGGGNFGHVVKGLYRTPSGQEVPVAVKTLKPNQIVNSGEREILAEARTMAQLKHRHIVRLIGVCKEEQFMLVLELAPLGPINKYLKKRPDVSVHTLTELMHQVALGMAYLESCKFVHRDLAARNVLLVTRHFAKISDFGMSKALNFGSDYYRAATAGKWPLKWYAPECIYYFRFDSKSDVWSYGITLWEVYSYGERPYRDMKGAQILAMLDQGLRLSRPSRCPESIYSVMQQCWNFEGVHRPTFAELVLIISRILRAMPSPQTNICISNHHHHHHHHQHHQNNPNISNNDTTNNISNINSNQNHNQSNNVISSNLSMKFDHLHSPTHQRNTNTNQNSMHNNNNHNHSNNTGLHPTEFSPTKRLGGIGASTSSGGSGVNSGGSDGISF
ncbi:Tyrosine-protein kinase SYK, partial [Schistosoma japonicum]